MKLSQFLPAPLQYLIASVRSPKVVTSTPPRDPIATPTAADLHQTAKAWVESVIADATPEVSRVIELAVKNGGLSVSIEIADAPVVRLTIDPGKPSTIEFTPK
jgi:hypothetical protein